MEIFKASEQWSTRPADQRFWTLAEMAAYTNAVRDSARVKSVDYTELRVQANAAGGLDLVGPANRPALLTNYAFGQLCQKVSAPAGYLRTLPASTAADLVTYGLRHNAAVTAESKAQLLFHENGGSVVRAATSDKYSRIWDADIVARLQDLTGSGWRTPPARPSGKSGERTRKATAEDVSRLTPAGGLAVKVGDDIAPAGLYASDHDMFAFLVNEDRLIDDGSGDQLARGFFVWNSEVGDKAFGVMTFLYKFACGNHIVWGAKGVQEIKVIHIGKDQAPKAFAQLAVELRKYSDDSASDVEARITEARRLELGSSKDDVIEAMLGIARKAKAPVLTQRALTAAYDVAESRVDRYGAPSTLWAMVNGITEMSQTSDFAEDRVALDRAAGKVLEAAF